MTDQSPTVADVLTRLLQCKVDDLTDADLILIGQLTKDSRALRKCTATLLHQRGWTFKRMGEVWEVDLATASRWVHDPTERRPGERLT